MHFSLQEAAKAADLITRTVPVDVQANLTEDPLGKQLGLRRDSSDLTLTKVPDIC